MNKKKLKQDILNESEKLFDWVSDAHEVIKIEKLMPLIDELDNPDITDEAAISHEKNPELTAVMPNITHRQVEDWLNEHNWYDHPTAEKVAAKAVDKGELSYYGDTYMVLEKPVIPSFIAETIESYKANDHSLGELLASVEYETQKFYNGMEKYRRDIDSFYCSNEDVCSIIARAWLGGYMVESKKYRARLKLLAERVGSYLKTQTSDPDDRLDELELGSYYIAEGYRHLSEFTQEELERVGVWDNDDWLIEPVDN